MSDRRATAVPGLLRTIRLYSRVTHVCFIVMVVLLVPFALLNLTKQYPEILTDLSPTLFTVLVMSWMGVMAIACFLSLFARARAFIARHHIRSILQAYNGMLCPGCGYDLSGVLDPKCPECARPWLGPEKEWQTKFVASPSRISPSADRS